MFLVSDPEKGLGSTCDMAAVPIILGTLVVLFLFLRFLFVCFVVVVVLNLL